MIRFFLRNLLIKNRELILKESAFMSGFMHLLMKPRNTGMHWTKDEKKELVKDIKHLSAYVPVMFIFLLPGGSMLLPFLSEILDRRKDNRLKPSKP